MYARRCSNARHDDDVPDGPRALPPNDNHASRHGANTVDNLGTQHVDHDDHDQNMRGGMDPHSLRYQHHDGTSDTITDGVRDLIPPSEQHNQGNITQDHHVHHVHMMNYLHVQTGNQAPGEHAHSLLVGAPHDNSVPPVHVHAGNLGSNSMAYDVHQDHDVPITVAIHTQGQASQSYKNTGQVKMQVPAGAERVMSNSVSMCYASEYSTDFDSNGQLQQATAFKVPLHPSTDESRHLDAKSMVVQLPLALALASPDCRAAACLPHSHDDIVCSSTTRGNTEKDSPSRWPRSKDTNSSLHTGVLSAHTGYTSPGTFRQSETGLSGVLRCTPTGKMNIDAHLRYTSADAGRLSDASGIVIRHTSTEMAAIVHTDAVLGCAVTAAPSTPRRGNASPSHLPVVFVPLQLDVDRMQPQWSAALSDA